MQIMTERHGQKFGSGTPTGRLPKTRCGLSSNKARAPFKSPYGKDAAAKESSPPQDKTSVKDEILQNLEAQRKLDEEINELRKQGLKVDELGEHITKLHEYNEIKDMGQMLLGQIAVKQGVTTKDLYEQFGLGLDD